MTKELEWTFFWPAQYYRSLYKGGIVNISWLRIGLAILLDIHNKHNLFLGTYIALCVYTYSTVMKVLMTLNMYYVIILLDIHNKLRVARYYWLLWAPIYHLCVHLLLITLVSWNVMRYIFYIICAEFVPFKINIESAFINV